MAQINEVPTCNCCNWRPAQHDAKDSINGSIIKFCNKCKGNHKTSPKFPGRPLEYDLGVSPAREYSSNPTSTEYSTCNCCQLFYYKAALQTIQYECQEKDHSAIYCLQCAQQHRMCKEDHSVATMPSFLEVLEKITDTKIDIKPYN
ncbi:PREDICTED: uncharacterized protein LOC109581178 [Amphimedon queenslandica]|uniref:Uncharacterized protein n=1 Tax=Amphimedon queenslandica TaxID=400682 RepID=A0A1X7V5B2_AMPQE|nr:PREDICTED: uncharacterized protein LOC109581178 [Amphimedon queenslandica]|eukprot:XP_019850597.1 PREDICTED: uncharacterized protein LOC109581178 [Amphimedon queenslandica]